MAQELVTVKNQLKSGVQIVGGEVTRTDEQVHLLDLESQKVQESFASQVAERVGETDERQTRHAAVTSHLHEAVQELANSQCTGIYSSTRRFFE